MKIFKVIDKLVKRILSSDMTEPEKNLYSKLALKVLMPEFAVNDPSNGEQNTSLFEQEIENLETIEFDNAEDIEARIRKSYKVRIKEGKWNYEGYIDFFGSHDSGIDRVRFWADDGEPGTAQALRIVCSNWQNLLNENCIITRYHAVGGQWHRKSTMFSGTLVKGRGNSGHGYEVNITNS